MTESKMTEKAATALRKPFPKESVGQLPKGGMMLDYVGHAAVTDRLLTVDPEWSWEPLALDERGLPALDKSGNLWIKLTICGVTRLGVGDGKSAKEAIGDAIRNAAMRFGVALDLWAKENLVEFAQAANSQPTRPEPPAEATITQPQSKALHAAFNDAGITAREGRLDYCRNLIGRDIATSNELTKAEASKVIEALKQDAQGSDA